MNRPVLSYDTPMGGTGTWAHTGGYSIWSLTHEDASAPLDLWERYNGAPVALPRSPYVLHNVAAGTPHRLDHVFGLWRISDIDTIFLKNEDGGEINYSFMLATGSPLYRSDHVAWYCSRCQAELRRESFETKRFGIDAFWNWALKEVRTFNRDAQARTCSACGAIHDPAYGLYAANDTPQEEDARTSW